MAELLNDIRHIPPWLIVAGVGGLGAVVLLTRRSSSGAVVSTVPAASITATPDGSLSASGLAGGPALGDASQLQSISTIPTVGTGSTTPDPTTVTPTPTPSPTTQQISGNPFSQWLQGGEGSTRAINQQQIQDYLAQGQEYSAQLNDPAFNTWLAQGYQYTNGGPGAGDQAGVQAWKQRGFSFLPEAIGAGDPVAPQVGLTGEILPAPVTRTVPVTAGGGSSEKIVDILPHGYATEMTPGVLERWVDWLGGTPPRAGLSDTQRYVARTTHHELAARHKAATDDAVTELLGGV